MKISAIRIKALSALFLLLAVLLWLFWPMRVTLEGYGMVQPRFEDLLRVVPEESGMVCRAVSKELQEVRKGDVIFEYIPEGQYSVLVHAKMTTPGNGASEPEPVPEWYRKAEGERIARIEAANRWSSKVLNAADRALRWERDLAARFAMSIPREADRDFSERLQKENIRLGLENANRVYIFDRGRGVSVPAEKGIPLYSPASGRLYSLWVQPGMQIFGMPAGILPALPTEQDRPAMALSAGGGSPVAEIMPEGTPLEVLALMPRVSAALTELKGWTAELSNERGTVAAAPLVQIGHISVGPDDAKMLMPSLHPDKESLFVRVELQNKGNEKVGSSVHVRLVSPLRPRIWHWLKADKEM